MREALLAQDALTQEGIFRLAGDQNEMKRIKGEMNRTKTFDANDADMNTIANLLKVLFFFLSPFFFYLLPVRSSSARVEYTQSHCSVLL
jgi:hypothetical protein